jgi:hypothetical protein
MVVSITNRDRNSIMSDCDFDRWAAGQRHREDFLGHVANPLFNRIYPLLSFEHFATDPAGIPRITKLAPVATVGQPYNGRMKRYPVSSGVNVVTNDDTVCAVPITIKQAAQTAKPTGEPHQLDVVYQIIEGP